MNDKPSMRPIATLEDEKPEGDWDREPAFELTFELARGLVRVEIKSCVVRVSAGAATPLLPVS